MPTRSTGCITCRKRKIRCDEARPGCQRCAVHGVRCPGYRSSKPIGIEFKDQTSVTAQRAEQTYRAKSLGSKTAYVSSRSSSSLESDVLRSVAFIPFTVSSENGDSSTASSEYDYVVDRNERFQSRSMSPVTTIAIRSPSAERSQIYEEFIATYLPKVRYGSQDGHWGFFQLIAQNRSEQPALQGGMDALSLVQLGSLYKDQRLLKEAVRRYGLALRQLTSSISRGDFLHDDDVLAAVTCLASCELYEEIATMGQGWGKHVEGANQLVAARGPKSIRSEMAMLLFSNMRHGALLYALISRRAPFMAAPEWRELALKSPYLQDESTKFYDVAIQVPGVLQRHDELDLTTPTALANIDAILRESMKLEFELRSWYGEWQADATLDNLNDCELMPIDSFPTFTSVVADRTFDHAYMFPDFLVAYLYSVYWMSMHYLRANIQSLQKMRHHIQIDWYPEPKDVVPETELLSYVLSLCQCIPFFVEPISNSAGHIGIFMPLRTAALYFTAHGHWGWLKWVGEVRNNVFNKGLAPPGVQHACKECGNCSPGHVHFAPSKAGIRSAA